MGREVALLAERDRTTGVEDRRISVNIYLDTDFSCHFNESKEVQCMIDVVCLF